MAGWQCTDRENIIWDGTINANFKGTAREILDSELSLVNRNFVESLIRGNVQLFFTNNASDIATYKDMEVDTVTATEETIQQTITAGSTTLIASFASILNEAEVDSITALEQGIYDIHTHAEADFPNGMTIYFEFYKRTAGGTETLLGTSHDSNILGLTETEINLHANISSEIAWIAGDRVVVKVYGRNTNAANKDITIHMEGTTLSRVEFPAFIPPQAAGAGDVTAAANMTDHTIIRGDGGSKGIQDSGITISDTDEIQLNKVGTNIITATNANGDLRLGAGGGTNDLKIDINGNVDVFGNLTIGGTATGIAPTVDLHLATKKYVDDNAGGQAFPIGSVYTAVVSTNPNTLLGYGTWSSFGSGRYLLGVDATGNDTGDTNGGTFASDSTVGIGPVSNVANVATSDNVWATVNYSGANNFDLNYIKVTNFSFNIPTNATITGIETKVEKSINVSSGDGTGSDNSVKIYKSDGSLGSEEKAAGGNWPTSDAYTTYGSSSDLWSETWTPADINDSDFGIAFSPHLLATTGSGNLRIDHITIKVYYILDSETEIGTVLSDEENRVVGQHNHDITDPQHNHSYTKSNFTGTGSTTSNRAHTATTVNTGSSTTGITIDNAGSVAGTNAPYIQVYMWKRTA